MRLSKTLLVIALILLLPGVAQAAMSSANYFIYADSLDYGGSESTSTSNNVQDSIGGEVALGSNTSTSYEIKAGYQSIEIGTLTLNLDSNTINFGQPAAGVVVISSLVATIDTNSETGYSLSVSSVSGSSLTAVGDGAVDGVGSTEEYGLAVSGSHAAYVTDAAIVANLVLASSVTIASGDATTLTFKAVRSANTAAQSYSQTLVLTAAAN
ncbi:MAG: hypothetical protein NT034_02625 [Candidatus Magasanikbacteria bacterium]|nr:hypothetical protein [Candidatus Magasanikbacteria bacterium]